MKLEREYVDGKGHKFRAVITLDEGSKLERAIQRLANKARSGPRQQATALDGAFHIIVHPVIEKGSL